MYWRIEFQLETPDTVKHEDMLDYANVVLQRPPSTYGPPRAIRVTDLAGQGATLGIKDNRSVEVGQVIEGH